MAAARVAPAGINAHFITPVIGVDNHVHIIDSQITRKYPEGFIFVRQYHRLLSLFDPASAADWAMMTGIPFDQIFFGHGSAADRFSIGILTALEVVSWVNTMFDNINQYRGSVSRQTTTGDTIFF